MENLKNIEILSPAGDINNFYTAIRSGADAVYFGLSKFNARIKADNIGLDNLSQMVDFAHLKGVKTYVTLNTLVTDKELVEVVELAGKCLEAGVDAFIVQDYGIISALKSTYPNIVLHGSTQMGIHNVRGARVAKALGLSRIVLSRECTVEDIIAIKNAVDIELEVFVQGAMCVAFSGNCYMSSIKCGASGNRGECKQLCRLPYRMERGRNTLEGFALSPRDNCMIDYIGELMDIGVSSIKIEGRLRSSSYVAVATSEYRKCVDAILKNKSFNCEESKNRLAEVFARGKYIAGYNDGNGIIDSTINNHIGKCVGKVVSCSKFKDMYKIGLKLTVPIKSGDGIKIGNSKNYISMGVGNVEQNGNIIYIFGKNYVDVDNNVYLSLDADIEKNIPDYSNNTDIKLAFVGRTNENCTLIIESKFGVVKVNGAVCSEAKSRPLDIGTITRQLSKTDNLPLNITTIDVDIDDNIFLPISAINEVRRNAIDELLSSLKPKVTKVNKPISRQDDNVNFQTFGTIAIIEDSSNIRSLVGKYDTLMLSPKCYTVGVVADFISKFKEHFDSTPFVNLPMIVRSADMLIIDDIVDAFKGDCIFVANNIYALDYISSGAKVFGNYNLNVTNSYSAKLLYDLGVIGLTASIEKWHNYNVPSMYKYSGKATLMTFTHCPNKTLCGGDCGGISPNSKCLHAGDIKLSGGGNNYTIRRVIVGNCYFELIDTISTKSNDVNTIIDLR